MESFRVIVNVAVSHVFYSWLFGFCGKMILKAAEEFDEQITNH